MWWWPTMTSIKVEGKQSKGWMLMKWKTELDDFFTLVRNIYFALVTSARGLHKQEYYVDVVHNREEHYQQPGVNSSEESLWVSRRFQTWPYWLWVLFFSVHYR